jgi:hypothetical protein
LGSAVESAFKFEGLPRANLDRRNRPTASFQALMRRRGIDRLGAIAGAIETA